MRNIHLFRLFLYILFVCEPQVAMQFDQQRMLKLLDFCDRHLGAFGYIKRVEGEEVTGRNKVLVERREDMREGFRGEVGQSVEEVGHGMAVVVVRDGVQRMDCDNILARSGWEVMARARWIAVVGKGWTWGLARATRRHLHLHLHLPCSGVSSSSSSSSSSSTCHLPPATSHPRPSSSLGLVFHFH